MPYLGFEPTASDTLSVFKYVATGSQTTFTGADANGATLSYDVGDGSCQVWLNGVRLDSSDITATNGTSVVLAACTSGDIVHIQATKAFIPADVVPKAAGGTFGGAVVAPSLTLSSTPLPVASGGSGAATHSANGVLLGAGTGALTTAAPGSSGNVLTSNGTVWASAAAPGFANWTESSGHLTPNSTSYGIHLGVATATAANLLDDYEEGTYNPVISGSDGGSFGLASGYDTYSYTKVGRLVMVSGYIDVTSDGDADGAVQVSLPFTPSALSESADQFHSWSIILTLHADAATNAQISCWTTSGIGNSRLYEQVHGTGAGSYLNHTEVDAVFGVSINLWYLT
jgi:hypothetical protein